MAFDALAALEHAPVALAVLEGPEHRIVVASAAFRELFGSGASATGLLASAVISAVERVRASGQPARVGQSVHGDKRYRAALQPVGSHVVVACIDITEDAAVLAAQRTACDEAAHEIAIRDRLIGAAAHELRAPLMTLLLWEQLLRTGLASGGDRDRALTAIHESATALSQLIGDLQDMARSLAGTLDIDIREVEVDRILHDALTRWTPAAMAKQLVLDLDVPAKLGSIHGNEHRLHQILGALFGHAIRQTPPSKTVDVRARRELSHIVIDVRDQGPGIAPDQLERLFEPFRDLDAALTPGEGGLGLALVLARSLTELHGGSLTVESEGIGSGAKFTLRLPTRIASHN